MKDLDAAVADIYARVDLNDLPVDRMVYHRRLEKHGWVLYEDNVGRGRGPMRAGRPTYKVMAVEGWKCWWYQDECAEVHPVTLQEIPRRPMSNPKACYPPGSSPVK